MIDQANYRAMSVPFADKSALDKALDSFWEGVAKLRKEHKLPDILMVIAAAYGGGDEDEGECEIVTAGYLGNELRAETLSAYALGYYQSQRQDRIAELVKGAVKKLRHER